MDRKREGQLVKLLISRGIRQPLQYLMGRYLVKMEALEQDSHLYLKIKKKLMMPRMF